jgi:tight adherence protein C
MLSMKDDPIDDPEDKKDKTLLVRFLMGIGSLVSSPKGPSVGLRAQLAKAGFQGRSAVTIFLGAKMLLLIIGLVGALSIVYFINLSFLHKSCIVMIGVGLPFFIPNTVLRMRQQSRAFQVRTSLPDVVDLLEICVSGGMGLDMAWNSVGEEIRTVSPLLADEMALTNLEMHLGVTRGKAISNMADRTGSEDLGSLVAVLVQSEKFGTSIAEALETFAKTMRELRSERAETAAQKMALKMLFPMILLIFPVVMIVAVGPAVIILIDLLG